MIENGELWLHGVHIPEYTEGTWTNHTPRRKRKLLVHKTELRKIASRTKDSGVTLVPLQLYFNNGKAKVEVAIATGKKAHDKRATLMEKQATRDINRELSRRQSGKDSF